MASLVQRPAIINTASIFVGITLPLVGAWWFFNESGSRFEERIKPDSAAEAVLDHLPQVAVIGTKEGPANTTEVFIQVPGVLNMQSVYVLSDGETIISGFVLPSMERGGVPGGQIEMPTGEATVNPAGAREGLKQLLDLLNVDSDVRAEVLAAAGSATEQDAGSGAASKAADTLPAPAAQSAVEPNGESKGAGGTAMDKQAVAANAENEENRLPAPSAGASENEPTMNPTASPQSSPVPTETGVTAQASDSSATIPAPVVPPMPSAPAQTQTVAQVDDQVSTPASSKSGQQDSVLGSLSIGEVKGAAQFTGLMKTLLREDPAIDAIRSLEKPVEQQAAYLSFVKDRVAVTQGDGPRHLYVFFDPNCPVCHDYYNGIQRKIDRGQVTVHWIPTVVFPDRRSSITASAQMLNAVAAGYPDQAREMLANIMAAPSYLATLDQHYSDDLHSHQLNNVVRGAATMTMARPETPLIVYETQGGELAMRTGLPTAGYIQEVKVED